MAKDRAANRQSRKASKPKNHEPLLRLVQREEEVRKTPTPPMETEVTPRNEAQRRLDNSIRVNTITFGIGPAGTGKTWLPAIRAAEALQARLIKRIIVTRPVIAAEGEDLGFLPGDLMEKYEPYIRPVRDALEEFFGSTHLEYLIKSGKIEPVPLGFIRGSTIKDAWLIADEMQNATVGQFKLLLTRIGENAKFVINGDPTQIDLPNPATSGLMDAVNRLKHIKSVGNVFFSEEDIVRSGMCQEIVRAYSKPNAEPLAPRYVENNDDTAGLRKTLRV